MIKLLKKLLGFGSTELKQKREREKWSGHNFVCPDCGKVMALGESEFRDHKYKCYSCLSFGTVDEWPQRKYSPEKTSKPEVILSESPTKEKATKEKSPGRQKRPKREPSKESKGGSSPKRVNKPTSATQPTKVASKKKTAKKNNIRGRAPGATNPVLSGDPTKQKATKKQIPDRKRKSKNEPLKKTKGSASPEPADMPASAPLPTKAASKQKASKKNDAGSSEHSAGTPNEHTKEETCSGHHYVCPACHKEMELWNSEYAAHRYKCVHCDAVGTVDEWPKSTKSSRLKEATAEESKPAAIKLELFGDMEWLERRELELSKHMTTNIDSASNSAASFQKTHEDEGTPESGIDASDLTNFEREQLRYNGGAGTE